LTSLSIPENIPSSFPMMKAIASEFGNLGASEFGSELGVLFRASEIS
jgi:hypothetical protein